MQKTMFRSTVVRQTIQGTRYFLSLEDFVDRETCKSISSSDALSPSKDSAEAVASAFILEYFDIMIRYIEMKVKC